MEPPAAKLTFQQINAVCRQVFGSAATPESVQEIGGGTFNETYRIRLNGEDFILRVAPSSLEAPYWDDAALMRREQNILPYFSSIASLLPQVIMTDFTKRVIERDYMFQRFLEGERWSDIEDALTPEENTVLWRQCGEIVKRMHATGGVHFGYPPPGHQFESWSEVIIDRFARIERDMLTCALETTAFASISAQVQVHHMVFDSIRKPHLLHGDLWTFNLLVKRGGGAPFICAVLDTDRAWWGDPLADWIMFLLSIRRDDPAWQSRLSAFHAGYGAPDVGEAAQFRQSAYNAMHIALTAVWGVRKGNGGYNERACRDLDEIAQTLTHLAA